MTARCCSGLCVGSGGIVARLGLRLTPQRICVDSVTGRGVQRVKAISTPSHGMPPLLQAPDYSSPRPFTSEGTPSRLVRRPWASNPRHFSRDGVLGDGDVASGHPGRRSRGQPRSNRLHLHVAVGTEPQRRPRRRCAPRLQASHLIRCRRLRRLRLRRRRKISRRRGARGRAWQIRSSTTSVDKWIVQSSEDSKCVGLRGRQYVLVPSARTSPSWSRRFPAAASSWCT